MAKPLHEALFNQAENSLQVRGDVQYTRELLTEASEQYKQHLNSGGEKISGEVYKRYRELQKELIARWLEELEAELPVVGGEQAVRDLNEFYKEFRSLMRLFEPGDFAKIRDEFIRIRDLASKSSKESSANRPSDIVEAEQLTKVADELSKELASSPDWDPREPRTEKDMPLLKLGRAIKALEGLLSNSSSSIQEAQLIRQLTDSVLNPAKQVVDELQKRVQELDEPGVTAFIPRADSMPISVAIQDHVTEDVSIITDESVLNDGISKLEQEKSAVDILINSLSPRYSEEILSELEELFPSKKMAHLEEVYKDYWNNKRTLIDSEIARRNARIKEYAERPLSLAEAMAALKNVIDEIESLDKLPVLVAVGPDVIAEMIKPAYDALEKYPVSSQDKEVLRQEVLLFDYRQTKRIINHSLTTSEVQSSESMRWYSNDLYDSRVSGQYGFGRLERVQQEIARQVSAGIATPDLSDEIASDRKRFESEIGFRRFVFVSEQFVEGNIWQSKGATAPERKYPEQNPPIFIGQESIPKVVLPSTPLPSEARLKFRGEIQYNYEVPQQQREIEWQPSFDHTTTKETFTPTLHGEIMRMLDLLYSDRMVKEYRKHLASKGGAPSAEDRKFVDLLNGYYRIMHQEKRKDEIPEVIQRYAKEVKNFDVSIAQIRHAWYLHTLFCNQSMLIPQSSPQTNDAIYKGNQALTYLTSGILAGTTPASIWEVGFYFGAAYGNDLSVKDSHGHPVTVSSTYNILDDMGRVDTSLAHMPEADTLPKKIGYSVAGVRTDKDSQSAREKIRETLVSDPHLKEFLFLADPPLVKIQPSEFGTLPIIPTVLQFMQIGNDSYDPATEHKTKKVVRWNGSADKLTPPVSAADYVDSQGNILYEKIPWDKVTKGTDITAWYNNGTNINKLYSMFMGAPSGDLLDRNNLPKEQNDTKYAAAFFPVLGPEVAADNFVGEKVFRRITIVHVFSRCITLLAQDKMQLHEIKHKLHGLNEVIGHDAVEAIDKALTVAYGQAEDLQRLRETYLKQLQDFLKFR